MKFLDLEENKETEKSKVVKDDSEEFRGSPSMSPSKWIQEKTTAQIHDICFIIKETLSGFSLIF